MDENDSVESRQAKLQQKAKRRAREDADDFKWLLSSKRGRRIVWRLLEQTGVFRSSFNNNSMAMAFAEGNRNLGLQMVAQVHALRPDAYALMVTENANDDRDTDDDGDAQGQ